MKVIVSLFALFISTSAMPHSSAFADLDHMMKHMDHQLQWMDQQHQLLKQRIINTKTHKQSTSFSENEDKLEISLTLEGMSEENINIALEGDIIVIKGEKTVESESGYSSSNFVQKLSLPKNANKDNISADFDNGILLITIPKLQDNNSDYREIEIQ